MAQGTNRLRALALVAATAAAGAASGETPVSMDDMQPASRQAAAAPRVGQTPQALKPGQPQLPSLNRVPGEYLVTLAPGAGTKTIRAAYGHLGIKRIKSLMQGVFLLTVNEDPGPEKMEALRKQNARIKAIQPNFTYRAAPGVR